MHYKRHFKINFTTPFTFETANITYLGAAYDSNAKNIFGYRDGSNSDYGTAVVFAASSTNLTSENFIGFTDTTYDNGDLATIQLGGSVNDKQTSSQQVKHISCKEMAP